MALGAGRGTDTMRVAARKSFESLCTCSLVVWEGMLLDAQHATSARAPDDDACCALPAGAACCQEAALRSEMSVSVITPTGSCAGMAGSVLDNHGA